MKNCHWHLLLLKKKRLSKDRELAKHLFLLINLEVSKVKPHIPFIINVNSTFLQSTIVCKRRLLLPVLLLLVCWFLTANNNMPVSGLNVRMELLISTLRYVTVKYNYTFRVAYFDSIKNSLTLYFKQECIPIGCVPHAH